MGAPFRYRSANFLHVGRAILDGLRQHVGIADEPHDAVIDFYAIEWRTQVAFPERDGPVRDGLRYELNRASISCEKPS